jgi:hypothetical protein
MPIAMLMAPRPHPWLWAPALGWAIHSVLALPLFGLIGMSRLNVTAAMAIWIAGASVALWRQQPLPIARPPTLLLLALIGAAILSLGPMLGILPKPTAEGMTLASPIFDHSKIAMIDEMIRSGVPVHNTFFAEAGTPDHVAYYYLWHFGAAGAALMTGVSGWEADAALTWFTAFASLLATIGVAMRIGGQSSSAAVVVVLAATASMRAALQSIWPDGTPALIGWTSGFGGWLFQTSWAPQHVASAMWVVTACVLLPQLTRVRGWLSSVVIGLIAAAAFESSVWVGGVVFALSATAIGLFSLRSLAPEQRVPFLLRAAAAAAVALILAEPFIHDQLVAAASRGTAALIALRAVHVLGDAWPEAVRRALDVPAYWLVYLPVEFPAFYPAGMIGLYLLAKNGALDPERQHDVRALSALVAASLVVAWLFASVIGDNNDLGWRAVLPAVMILIAFAAALVARWPYSLAKAATILAAIGALLSLPETVKIVRENLFGPRKSSERAFAATPSMWEAVRRHTSPTERVANNPAFLADMTPWPVNISWALIADRRSCYAGSELAIPFAPIPSARRTEIETQFLRIFAGNPAPRDVRQMAERFHCDTVVVTPQDGAWQHDPFASGEFYKLVEARTNEWRIYRRIKPRS